MISPCATWHQRWRISHGNALATRHMFALVIFGPQGSWPWRHRSPKGSCSRALAPIPCRSAYVNGKWWVKSPLLLNFSAVLTKLASCWYLKLPNCCAVCSGRCSPELWALHIFPLSHCQHFCSRAVHQLLRTCLRGNGPAPAGGSFLDKEA
jgi:hypothetical protein